MTVNEIQLELYTKTKLFISNAYKVILDDNINWAKYMVETDSIDCVVSISKNNHILRELRYFEDILDSNIKDLDTFYIQTICSKRKDVLVRNIIDNLHYTVFNSTSHIQNMKTLWGMEVIKEYLEMYDYLLDCYEKEKLDPNFIPKRMYKSFYKKDSK